MDSVEAAAAIPETNNEKEMERRRERKIKIKTQLKISIPSEEIKCTVLISSSASVLRSLKKNEEKIS